jgi:NAD(P)-dependent dehydrogenase (short-subunit alcohol dehydrogenase family)
MTDLSGKTIIVTGANTGIGRVTATELASRGAHVILACRSEDKTRPVLDEIAARGGSAEFLALDLGDLGSVRRAAQTFLDSKRPLHVLINNAGLAGKRAVTKDGFELAFGTNHLGPFLFTTLLLPRLRETGTAGEPARIVNVASKAHFDAKGIDFDAVRKKTRTITGVPEYEVSKLANVLFTKELARGKAGPNVHSYAVHPGVIASDAWRQIPWPIRPLMTRKMLTVEEGAKTTLYCATSPEVRDQDGLYYDTCREKQPSALALDETLAEKLWRESEAMTAQAEAAAR